MERTWPVEEWVETSEEIIAFSGPSGCKERDLWTALAAHYGLKGSEEIPAGLRKCVLERLEKGDAGIRWDPDSNPGEDEQPLDSLVLKAPEDLQNAALGLYDALLNTRFALSDVQLQTLRLIGASGTQGALQSQLAAAVGSENRNFFYVIRNLEQRGLVTKRPAVVSQPRSNNYFSNSIQTNIVHLSRFAPNLGRSARLLDAKLQLSPDGNEQPDVPEDGSSFGAVDDAVHFRNISQQLQSLQDGQAIESELKVSLGLTGVRGHRLWRRLKGAMTRRGCIEEFIGQHKSKPVKCIRLLKPWVAEESEESEGDDEDREPGIQIAEQILDRQMLKLILDAGEHGITVSEIHARLGLNLKRNAFRLKELERRYGLKSATTNQGRMLVGRYRASDAMLERYRTSQAPPVGPSEEEAQVTATGGKSQEAQQQSLRPDPQPPPTTPAPKIPAVEQQPPTTFRKACGELHHARAQWLVEEVKRAGFMLAAEMGRFLARQESERLGKPLGPVPDRKTCVRVVQRAVAAGLLSVVTINIPSKHGMLQNRSQKVLVPPDTVPDEELVSRVFKHYQSYTHFIRSRNAPNSLASLAARAVDQGALLPQVEGARLFQPLRRSIPTHGEEESRAAAMQQQIMNGYQVGKLVRASTLHQGIMMMTQPELDKPDQENAKLYIVTSMPKSLAPSRQETITLDADYNGDDRHIISAAMIWENMTVQMFLQVIGCSTVSNELVALAASSRTLGSLDGQESVLLWENTEGKLKCQSLLSQLLDLLCRIGLLSSTVPLVANQIGAQAEQPSAAEENLYCINRLAYIEHDDGKKAESYDLDSPENVRKYWAALEDAALETGAGKRGVPLSSSRLSSFPFDRAPEAATDRAWLRRRALSPQQQATLLAAVGEDGLATLTMARCRELAASMDLHIDAVMSFVRQRKARRRAERLQGLGVWKNLSSGGQRPNQPASMATRSGSESESMSSSSSSSSDEEHQLVTGLEQGSLAWPALHPALLFTETSQRKARWHPQEDKQLLRCWVRFLAANGPDKVLFWRRIPDRPPGLRAASLRHRLKVLQRSETTADRMQNLRSLAVAIHLRGAPIGSSVHLLGVAQEASIRGASEANRESFHEETTPHSMEEPVSGDHVAHAASKKPKVAAPPLFQIVGLNPTEEEEGRGTELIAAIAENAPGQYKHASDLPPAWRLALSRQRQLRNLEEQQQEEESEEEEEDESADEEDQREVSISVASRGEQEAVSERVLFSRLLQLIVRPENEKEHGDAESVSLPLTPSPAVLGSRLLAALLQWELGHGLTVPTEQQSPPGTTGLMELVTELQHVPHHVLKAAAGNLVACGAINPPGSARHPLRISPGLRNMLQARPLFSPLEAVFPDGGEVASSSPASVLRALNAATEGLAKLELGQIDLKGPELLPDATDEQRQAAESLGHLEATISVQCREAGNAIRSEKEREEALVPVEESTELNRDSNSMDNDASNLIPAGEQPFKDDTLVEQQPADATLPQEGPPPSSEHNVSNGASSQFWVGVDGKAVLKGVWGTLANRVVEAVAAQPGIKLSELEKRFAILGGSAPALISGLMDAQVLETERIPQESKPTQFPSVLGACFVRSQGFLGSGPDEEERYIFLKPGWLAALAAACASEKC